MSRARIRKKQAKQREAADRYAQALWDQHVWMNRYSAAKRRLFSTVFLDEVAFQALLRELETPALPGEVMPLPQELLDRVAALTEGVVLLPEDL